MAKKSDTNTDCPAFPTGDIGARDITNDTEGVVAAPSVDGGGFRYIGPQYRNGCVYKGRKLFMSEWTEDRAKSEIEKDSFFSKYFQFPNQSNNEA